MIDENTIGKYVSKYGEIEYEQNPDTDDTAWRRIKDLELFAGVIFITLKRSEELAGTEKDLSAIKKVLREKFLEPISSKEYDICYCLPGLNEDVWDRILFVCFGLYAWLKNTKRNWLEILLDCIYVII